MAFIEPMHRNKPNITYLLVGVDLSYVIMDLSKVCENFSSVHKVF